jgi:hypothetical protein
MERHSGRMVGLSRISGAPKTRRGYPADEPAPIHDHGVARCTRAPGIKDSCQNDRKPAVADKGAGLEQAGLDVGAVLIASP